VKIALICPYDWTRHGGVRAHVANLAEYLSADHEVRVFAPSGLPMREHRVQRVGRPVPIPYNGSIAPVVLSPLAARRLITALDAFRPHVLHVHEPLAPILSLAVTGFGPHPLVGTFHAWSASGKLYRAVSPMGRRLVRRLDARLAVSPAAQQYAAGALGLPMGAFRVVPNGVNVEAFAAAEPLGDLADHERPLLLFVGRLEPRKGLDVLVRTFLRLRSRMPRLRLCVVGEGPERDRCQQMIPPSIRPDVLFVGRVAQEDLARYHASADLFVSPATGGESFGIVLLEAMAAGLPIVASDIPGYRTVMKDGRQGRLVPPNDAFALADAVATLLANDRLRRAMAEEGRQTAAEHGWAVIGRRILEVYRSVL
jgi:phosphatidyl-myo-inositol alpha-mannosyltransferase